MRSIRRVLLLAAAACWVAPTAWAAVTNSHHDLSAYTGGGTEEVCYFCHGITDATAGSANFGNVGDLCLVRCHAGTGGANFTGDPNSTVIPEVPASIDEAGAVVASTATVNAVNVTAAYAHGLVKSDLLNPVDGSTQVTFDAIGTAFPYGAGSGDMECTTCHNVHDNTNTPFLQADLFTGGPGGTTSFCEACHTDRGNTFNGAGGTNTEALPSGEHPVDVSLTLGDVTTRTLGGRAGRYIQIDTASGGENVFDVTSANGIGLDGLNGAGTYITGGKVSGFAAAANGTTMSCYTCHSPHMDGTTGGTPNLVLRDTVSTDGTWNPLCVSCHGQLAAGSDNVEQNPGLSTSAFYHPVGPSAPAMVSATGNVVTFNNSVGSFTFDVDLSGIVTYTAAGSLTTGGVGINTTTYRPRCTSCHDAHGGAAGTMAIADIDGANDGTLAGAVCYECHTGVGLPDLAEGATGYAGEAANVHHRTRVADAIGTGTITDADSDTLTIDAASWQGAAPTGDTFGNLADGLSCPDCHVFNGTAHNW